MSSCKNVLLVISKFPPEYSGPGVRIPRLYQWFKAQGKDFNLRVVCNGIEQTKSAVYECETVPVERICADFIYSIFSFLSFLPQRLRHSVVYQAEFLKTLWVLCRFSRYAKTDLLHLAGHSGGTAAALLWAHWRKIPVLMELVTARAPVRQPYLFFFKTPQIERLCVVALTRDMKDRCLRAGLDEEKIWCRPNPIDEAVFALPSEMQAQDLRARFSGFTKDQIVLVSVAKMMPQKNQILAIEMLQHLPQHFCAIVAGPFIADGPLHDRDFSYVESIKKLISHHNLEDRVLLVTDFVTAADYIKAGDIYLMPAWNEGFGTPMIEAMGCGRPVIANKDEPAFQEWIVDGENGYLCDIHDVKSWTRAAEELAYISQEKRRKISSSIHKKAGQKAIYAQYDAIIKDLTAFEAE